MLGGRSLARAPAVQWAICPCLCCWEAWKHIQCFASTCGYSAAGVHIGISSGVVRLWRRAREEPGSVGSGTTTETRGSQHLGQFSSRLCSAHLLWGVRGCPGFSHRFLIVSVSLRAGQSTCPQQVVACGNALSIQGRTACTCGKPYPCERVGQDWRFGRAFGRSVGRLGSAEQAVNQYSASLLFQERKVL